MTYEPVNLPNLNNELLAEPTFFENGTATRPIAKRIKQLKSDEDPNLFALYKEWHVITMADLIK